MNFVGYDTLFHFKEITLENEKTHTFKNTAHYDECSDVKKHDEHDVFFRVQ